MKKAVKNAEYILHAAAFVSPATDYYPDMAWDININDTKNIIEAIRDQNNLNNVKLIYRHCSSNWYTSF